MSKAKKQPSESWLKKMIKDEKEGIKKYSNMPGFKKQLKQEKAHLKKLESKLKKRKY